MNRSNLIVWDFHTKAKIIDKMIYDVKYQTKK